MRLEITRATLEAAEACVDGLEDFDDLLTDLGVTDGVLRLDWTRDGQIMALLCEPWRRHFGWLIAVGIVPVWSMQDADLSGASLYRASLSGADLRGADISGANLRGANLYRADLSGASLRGADLNGADISGANLSGADLNGAVRSIFDPPIPGWTVVDGRLRLEVSDA